MRKPQHLVIDVTEMVEYLVVAAGEKVSTKMVKHATDAKDQGKSPVRNVTAVVSSLNSKSSYMGASPHVSKLINMKLHNLSISVFFCFWFSSCNEQTTNDKVSEQKNTKQEDVKQEEKPSKKAEIKEKSVEYDAKTGFPKDILPVTKDMLKYLMDDNYKEAYPRVKKVLAHASFNDCKPKDKDKIYRALTSSCFKLIDEENKNNKSESVPQNNVTYATEGLEYIAKMQNPTGTADSESLFFNITLAIYQHDKDRESCRNHMAEISKLKKKIEGSNERGDREAVDWANNVLRFLNSKL